MKASFGVDTFIRSGTQWIEPIWKMLWSNKALLAVLWEMYPDHPLLLPASLDLPPKGVPYITKPLLGREGLGVQFYEAGEQPRPTGEPIVYQAKASMAKADGVTAVIGSWVIDGVPAGMVYESPMRL